MRQRVAWRADDGVRRPDVLSGISFTVIEDHGDGTVTVEINDPREAERELQDLRDAIDALTLALLETP